MSRIRVSTLLSRLSDSFPPDAEFVSDLAEAVGNAVGEAIAEAEDSAFSVGQSVDSGLESPGDFGEFCLGDGFSGVFVFDEVAQLGAAVVSYG